MVPYLQDITPLFSVGANWHLKCPSIGGIEGDPR